MDIRERLIDFSYWLNANRLQRLEDYLDENEVDEYMKSINCAFEETQAEKNQELDGKTAEDIVNINLGYFAGYYDNETRERVERLFCTKHPIFGSVESNGSPTAKEAFTSGLNAT